MQRNSPNDGHGTNNADIVEIGASKSCNNWVKGEKLYIPHCQPRYNGRKIWCCYFTAGDPCWPDKSYCEANCPLPPALQIP
ncbi:unnamed protein product [Ilex paraguariensis]|uniref:Uncharacterized protein n=1 Tax=Ilex paraguariensis TaxID=185542 RepID=A0ABC8T5D7_9AQUA